MWKRLASGLQTLPIDPETSADPVKDGISRKVTKASALPKALLARCQ